MLKPLGAEAVALSAQHIIGESAEEDGVLSFWLTDEEEVVEISHEIGDPDAAAAALFKLADKIRAHAEDIRARGYGRRMRTQGWT